MNETRGSTLEVVISRMKTRNESIRFLLVSATVPNIRDIADWMDSSREPKTCEVLEVRLHLFLCILASMDS